MIKSRLKELDIKITELANYLSISRPTMYKFIEMYDGGEKKELTKSMCELFDYIEKNKLIDKKNVINYILKNDADLRKTEPSDNDDSIMNREIKSAIVEYISVNDDADEIINYIIDSLKSSKKKKPTKKDQSRIESLKRIQGIINVNLKEDK